MSDRRLRVLMTALQAEPQGTPRSRRLKRQLYMACYGASLHSIRQLALEG